ncbi:hypothetical protein DFH06DRAFT_1472432 [Mycena polygramma]|nr:hypothetical protein DFH06DRAFT_1472432 [Mycena polygramma]
MSSTHDTAIIQSPLVGDIKGPLFNDIANVVGTGNITINTVDPIKELTVMHGQVIDGLMITYDRGSGSGSTTTTITHGTSDRSTDPELKKTRVQLLPTEAMIAITGQHGPVARYGTRVTQLSFVIYNSATGGVRIAGPFGTTSSKSFYATADGNFVAFGGYAVDTDDSVGQSAAKGQDGGLYGLTFSDVAYRTV